MPAGAHRSPPRSSAPLRYEGRSLPPACTPHSLLKTFPRPCVIPTRTKPQISLCPWGQRSPPGSSDPQPCRRGQSCPPARWGAAELGGTALQRRAEGGTPHRATRAPVLGFSGTGEQLGGQVAQPGCSRGWAKGWLPSPSSAPHPEPRPLQAWQKAHLIFLSPASVSFEAIRLFFFHSPPLSHPGLEVTAIATHPLLLRPEPRRQGLP